MPLRFAILDHDWPHPHRDLFLERAGVLKAWRLPAGFDPDVGGPAEALPDHRRLYLDYEGLVSGDRGLVSRLDGGELAWLTDGPARAVVRLSGRQLNGVFELIRDADSKVWSFRRLKSEESEEI